MTGPEVTPPLIPPPSSRLTLTFSPVGVDLCRSSHCATVQPEELSVSMYLFVFSALAWIIECICGYLRARTAQLGSCQLDKKKTHTHAPKKNQKNKKLQKHLAEKSTTVEVIVRKNSSSAAAVNIVDFKGNTAGAAARKLFNWTQSEIFNLHRNNTRQVHMYAHSHMPALKRAPTYRLNAVTSVELINPQAFWL